MARRKAQAGGSTRTPFSGETRGRLISLLRRGVRTVEELAALLGVTDNAVRAQIQQLESAGIVDSVGTRKGAGAGKPATLYRIVPSAEPNFSSAYAPVLGALLATLTREVKPAKLDSILREAGKEMASSDASPRASLESRVNAVASVLTTLGAEVDVERTDSGFALVGHSCSLSMAVGVQPGVCHLIEEFVAEQVGAPVRECCDRAGASPRCRFDIRARSA
jgi:predicted ArsR family transcriptional regulator